MISLSTFLSNISLSTFLSNLPLFFLPAAHFALYEENYGTGKDRPEITSFLFSNNILDPSNGELCERISFMSGWMFKFQSGVNRTLNMLSNLQILIWTFYFFINFFINFISPLATILMVILVAIFVKLFRKLIAFFESSLQPILRLNSWPYSLFKLEQYPVILILTFILDWNYNQPVSNFLTNAFGLLFDLKNISNPNPDFRVCYLPSYLGVILMKFLKSSLLWLGSKIIFLKIYFSFVFLLYLVFCFTLDFFEIPLRRSFMISREGLPAFRADPIEAERDYYRYPTLTAYRVTLLPSNPIGAEQD